MTVRTWFNGEDEYRRIVGSGSARPDAFAGPSGPSMVMTPHGLRYEKRINLCAYVTRSSENPKLIRVCTTTYASQVSCPRPGDGVSPKPCPLYHHGCYGEHGQAGLAVRELNENAACVSATNIADAEATAIRQYTDDVLREGLCPQPIRLHTVGDCSTPEGARMVASACNRYVETTGAPVWSYTHAWNVPRSAWGRVSMLQSVHSVEEGAQALARGYAPAFIVKRFKNGGRTYRMEHGVIGLPCPSFWAKKTCPECRYCWDDANLRKNRLMVLFLPHGEGKVQAAQTSCPGTCSIG